MAVRRPIRRVSSGVLSAEASPYHAICQIIGAGLRTHYRFPEQTPSYMQILLQELDDEEETNSDRASEPRMRDKTAS